MLALALDPGETTGYAWGVVENEQFTLGQAGQEEWDEIGLWSMLESISPLHVVAEKFEYRNRPRDGLVLVSRNLLGVLELWCSLHHRYLYLQSASEGKGFFKDARLRASGAYITGKPHANDAQRHLLYWLLFKQGSKLISKESYADLLRKGYA